MEAIASWLQRLKTAEPGTIRSCVTPTLAAGFQALALSNSIVALEPKGQIPSRVGDCAPLQLSLLHYPETSASTSNLGIQEDLRNELGAILSFITNRRVLLPNVIALSLPGVPQSTFLGYGSASDRRLNGPIPSGAEGAFQAILEKIVGIPEKPRLAIGTALRLHHASVELFESDLRAAYLFLVAGLEIMSREFGETPNNWEDWEDHSDWNETFEVAVLSNEQKELIRKKLMSNRQLRLKATFRTYISTRVPDEFWSEAWDSWIYGYNFPDGPWLPPHNTTTITTKDIIPADRKLLSKMLGYTYDFRSGMVHRGSLIKFHENSIPQGGQINFDGPLPYALLRSILRSILSTELEANAGIGTLPNIQITPNSPQPAN